MQDVMRTFLVVLSSLFLSVSPASAQTQIPPPIGLPSYGIVCDGATQMAAALQNAVDTVPLGTTITLPPGLCVLNATVTIGRAITLVGAGMNHTTLRQTIPSLPVLRINAAGVRVSGLYLSHFPLPDVGGDGLIVEPLHDRVFLDHLTAAYNYRGFVLGSIAYGAATHLTAENNNSHGFEFVYNGFGGAQWDVAFTLAQANKGAGYVGNVGTFPQGLGPFLTQTTSFLNTQGGYIFSGSPGHTLYDVRLSNVLSSYDNEAGIYLNTYGGSHLIDNPWIEYTGMASAGLLTGADLTPFVGVPGHCLAVSANNAPGLTITGGNYINCGWSAVALDANFVSFTGGASYDYGAALDPEPARRAGVTIAGNNVVVSGHAFDYHAAFPLHYIYLRGSPVGVSIGHNTYNSTGLALSQFVGVAPGTTITGLLPSMAAGLAVHTNRVGSPALTLYDATNGPTPTKSFRVNAGSLQIRNAAETVTLATLSDAGTPGWPQRRGQVTITGATTTASVALSPAEPDNTFSVQLTAVSQTGGPAAGAFTPQGVSKATGGFVVTLLAAPGPGTSVTYDWLVHR